jgi:uncharacterized protein
VPEAFSKFKTRYIFIDIILITFATGIFLAVASGVTGIKVEDLGKNPFIVWTLNPFIMIAVCLCIIRRLNKSGVQMRHLIGDTSNRGIPWLMLLIVFYGIETLERGLSQLSIFFTHLIFPEFAKLALANASISFKYNTDSLTLNILFHGLLFINVVVVAPLAEEFFFRGVLLHRLASKWGITAGILLSSALFGLSHANIYMIAIGISSIFFALVYIKIPSLVIPIVFHGMNNTIWMISRIVRMVSPIQDSTEITVQSLWLGLLNTAFALPILFYFLKWPTNFDLLPYTMNNQNSISRQS